MDQRISLKRLFCDLQILGAESGWKPIPLTDLVSSASVRKAYRKATLYVHPDKLQQRGASTQQKYICEKVFDLLKVCLSLCLTRQYKINSVTSICKSVFNWFLSDSQGSMEQIWCRRTISKMV